MKQYLSIILSLILALSLILTAAGCTGNRDTTQTTVGTFKYIGDRELKLKFDSITTISAILDDVSVIDLDMEMGSITGLDKETEEDVENSTSIDYYYRNKELIYAVYNGYGENVWKYYTTSKAGTPIIASFWDEGNGPSVTIETNDDELGYAYNIHFENVSKDFSNGAEKIYVTASKGGESFTYLVDGEKYYISSAVYWKDDALHSYLADADNGKLTYNYDEVVISSNIPEVDSADKEMLEVGISSDGFMSANLLLGTHEIYMNKEGDIYISAETTLIFGSYKDAEQAIFNMQDIGVKASDFTVDDSYGEDIYAVDVGTCVFAVSKEYKDAVNEFSNLAIEEFDDWAFYELELDENGDILSMKHASISIY